MIDNETNGVTLTEITAEASGQRLDNYLLGHLKGMPKSHLYRIIRKGEVRINKKRVKPFSRLQAGDMLRLPPMHLKTNKKTVIAPEEAHWTREHIVFDNGDFIVFNKPSGLACHGGSGVNAGVIELLRAAFADDSLELVHRLDKPTSGCLLIARKKSVLRLLHALLREKQMKKTYFALLHGKWEGPKQRVIDAPLLRVGTQNTNREVVVSAEGKPSKTMFKLIENYHNACLVEAHPVTGRTHQIRVHAKSMSQPIIGDTKYGLRSLDEGLDLLPNRLFLHAKKIYFTLDKAHHFDISPLGDWHDFILSLRG
jgi:23S rRNA pseudouridine955/2504/2580 synthase